MICVIMICVPEHLTHQGLNLRGIENFNMLPLNYYVMTMMLSIMSSIFCPSNYKIIQGAAEKSNPLTCFANSLATDSNFLMKLCIDIVCSYLHVTFKCYLIILKYDKVM